MYNREHELNTNFYDSFSIHDPLEQDWDEWNYDEYDYYHEDDEWEDPDYYPDFEDENE